MAYEKLVDQIVNPDYRGEATRFIWEFTVNLPDQAGAQAVAQQALDGHIQELINQGSELIAFKMWMNPQSGTWTTDFKCEVTAAGYGLEEDISGMAVAWFIPVIIIGVIAVIALAITGYIITQVKHISEYAGPVGISLMSVAVAILAAGGLYILVRRST